jgi:hypothetical protein
MRKLESEEFKQFLEGVDITQQAEVVKKGITKEIEASILFIIVKTASCPKCEALVNRSKEIFKDVVANVAYYTFNTKDQDIAKYFATLDIASVPVIVTRFKTKEGEFKLGKIIPDYEEGFVTLTNIFDAVNDNDQRYFGYNEFDEIIEDSDHDYMMNRVLRSLYGELDPEVERERKRLAQSIEN